MQGDTFEFENADAGIGASLTCVVECTPPTAGYYAAFVLQNSDPAQAPIMIGPSRSATFPISAADVAAGAGYTLNVTPAATAAGGTFTVKLEMAQKTTALGGTIYSVDPNANPSGSPMQRDRDGYVTAESGVQSGRQTYYGISIVSA